MIYRNLIEQNKAFANNNQYYECCLLMTKEEAQFLITVAGLDNATGVKISWNSHVDKIVGDIHNELADHFMHIKGVS